MGPFVMADPVPVAVHGVTLTSLLVGVLNIICGGVLVALIRNKPLLQRIKADSFTQRQLERREDIKDMRDRIQILETKVEEAQGLAHAVELKLITTMTAFRLVASELQMYDQSSQTLKQALELIGMAAMDDMRMDRELLRRVRDPLPNRGKKETGTDTTGGENA